MACLVFSHGGSSCAVTGPLTLSFSPQRTPQLTPRLTLRLLHPHYSSRIFTHSTPNSADVESPYGAGTAPMGAVSSGDNCAGSRFPSGADVERR